MLVGISPTRWIGGVTYVCHPSVGVTGVAKAKTLRNLGRQHRGQIDWKHISLMSFCPESVAAPAATGSSALDQISVGPRCHWWAMTEFTPQWAIFRPEWKRQPTVAM
jgi:hypothetical protein